MTGILPAYSQPNQSSAIYNISNGVLITSPAQEPQPPQPTVPIDLFLTLTVPTSQNFTINGSLGNNASQQLVLAPGTSTAPLSVLAGNVLPTMLTSAAHEHQG